MIRKPTQPLQPKYIGDVISKCVLLHTDLYTYIACLPLGKNTKKNIIISFSCNSPRIITATQLTRQSTN